VSSVRGSNHELPISREVTKLEILLKAKVSCLVRISALFLMFVCGVSPSAWASTATTTALTIFSAANTDVSDGSVSSGTEVLLAATVNTGTVGVSPGQVNFCDASAESCTDIHLIATAQLFQSDPGAGIAFFAFRPGIGSHRFKAVFLGTPKGTTAYAGSASSEVTLTVTGTFPTKTAISGSGNAGNYTLTGTVTGLVNHLQAASPTGQVSFLDTSNSNLSLGSAALGPGTEAFSFENSSNPTTGISPISVAVGDFNGDGIPDLVTADSGSNSVTILMGNGDGSFRPATQSPVPSGRNPEFVTVGDFNSDNNTDIAVANYSDGTVSILLGNGDGTFTPATNSPVAVGRNPLSIAVGDFSDDGIPDLAVANVTDRTVTILLGNGNGTFSQAAHSPIPVAGASPASVGAADFNRDGTLDLVVSVVGPNEVSILLGDGDGTFTEAANSPIRVGLAPYSVAVGDFNGDGNPDLVTANDASVNSNPGTVTILLGGGDGTFAEASGSPIPVGINPLIVAMGDFDADGKVDLAVTNENDNSAAILIGIGDGTFTHGPAVRTPAGHFPLSVATADLNGDGLVDLAVTNTDLINSTAVMVLLSQITRTATATVNGVAPSGTGTHLVAASYPGESIFGSSVSTSTVGLIGSPAPSFTIGSTAVTVVAGAVAGNVSNIAVTPAGGFTGTVTLSAAITSSPAGAQNLPSLSFGSTSPVLIAGNATGTANLTISTTAGTARASLAEPGRPRDWRTQGGATLTCVLLFGIVARRRRWQTALLALALLAVLSSGLAACGAGGGRVTGSPGTTAGNYTVTITGTSGTTTATSTLTLTVQ
jgi:hypothetical protein